MSSVYNTEPAPTAKVILHTTAGEIEVELFAKQTPLTSRNFLQLCLDGYYDNTVFHRLVKGFILQGGDPTGTGQGGVSSFDSEPFQDEFHSRLKFNRRGLLGMANTGKKNDNGSQFFFTLGKTAELDGQNTMFGRVSGAGNTIFNLMKMADADLAEGSEDRPMYPYKLTHTEIIINPFEDMVKTVRAVAETAVQPKKVKKPKRKAGKVLLSFGGDDDEGLAAPAPKKAKFNTKLVNPGTDISTASKSSKARETQGAEKAPTTGMSIPIRRPTRTSPSRSSSPSLPPSHEAPPAVKARNNPPAATRAISISSRASSRESSPESVKESKLDRVNAQIAAVKESMKRTTAAPSDDSEKKKSMLESMVLPNTTRGRKRGAGANNTASEAATLKLLSDFKKKLEAIPAEAAKTKSPDPVAEGIPADDGKAKTLDAPAEEACDLHFIVGCQSCSAWDKQDQDESDDDAGWMSHKLSFAKDRLGKDLEFKRRMKEELVVIDPEEMARELKSQKKTKREWDNEKGKPSKLGLRT